MCAVSDLLLRSCIHAGRRPGPRQLTPADVLLACTEQDPLAGLLAARGLTTTQVAGDLEYAGCFNARPEPNRPGILTGPSGRIFFWVWQAEALSASALLGLARGLIRALQTEHHWDSSVTRLLEPIVAVEAAGQPNFPLPASEDEWRAAAHGLFLALSNFLHEWYDHHGFPPRQALEYRLLALVAAAHSSLANILDTLGNEDLVAQFLWDVLEWEQRSRLALPSVPLTDRETITTAWNTLRTTLQALQTSYRRCWWDNDTPEREIDYCLRVLTACRAGKRCLRRLPAQQLQDMEAEEAAGYPALDPAYQTLIDQLTG